MKTPNEEEMKILLDLLAKLHGALPNSKTLIPLLSKPLLDTADLAVIFQKSKGTIRRWRKMGVVQSTQVLRTHYYKPESVKKLLGLGGAI